MASDRKINIWPGAALLLWTWLPLVVCAQIQESDTVRFKAKAVFSGNHQAGNIQFLGGRAQLDLLWTEPFSKLVVKTQNQYRYQAFFGKKADEDIFSRTFLYYAPEKTLYPFLMGFVSTNFRRKIRLRHFTGAGLTRVWLRNQNHLLKTSLALVYEETLHRASAFNPNVYNGSPGIRVWRPTIYISGHHGDAGKSLRFFYEAYAQQGLDRAENYRIQVDVGLEAKIFKAFNFSVLYTITHENVVVAGLQKTDRLFSLGFSWSTTLLHRR